MFIVCRRSCLSRRLAGWLCLTASARASDCNCGIDFAIFIFRIRLIDWSVVVADLCKQDRLPTCWDTDARANEERRAPEQLCPAC